MSSLTKSLFRPGKGSTIAQYTCAVADGVIYPADWVSLATTAPTSQGASGVFEGQTLALTDFIEASLMDTDVAGHEGLALGVVMGKGIGSVAAWSNVLPHVLADGDIMIIQNWGIHPQGRQVASGVAGDQLAPSATAGEPTNSTTVAVADVGNCMVATATYQRATAADEDGSVVFVKCI